MRSSKIRWAVMEAHWTVHSQSRRTAAGVTCDTALVCAGVGKWWRRQPFLPALGNIRVSAEECLQTRTELYYSHQTKPGQKADLTFTICIGSKSQLRQSYCSSYDSSLELVGVWKCWNLLYHPVKHFIQFNCTFGVSWRSENGAILCINRTAPSE